MLANIAEVDARKLYLPAAYPSMHSYCVHVLGLSEDAAFRRITAARAARDFPVIFDAIADGSLHLSAVGVLARWLTPGNANEFLKAAAHKSKAEVDRLIAERFPRSEMLALVEAVPALSTLSSQLVPGRVGMTDPEQTSASQLATARANFSESTKVAPIAAQRFAIHFVINQQAHDKLRYAQELMSHQVRARGHRRDLRTLARRTDREPREAQVLGDESPPAAAAPEQLPARHPRAHSARCLGARRRPLHVCERSRNPLPLAHSHRV